MNRLPEQRLSHQSVRENHRLVVSDFRSSEIANISAAWQMERTPGSIMLNTSNIGSAPFIVLGMHKSGTTLVSEVLHRSGICMIENANDASYDDGNKLEHDECRALNVDLLKSAGLHSVQTVTPLDIAAVTTLQWQKGHDLLERYVSEKKAWGFKDPRTLLTLPYWTKIAPTSHLVGVFRDPVEVFQHYAKKPWPIRFRDNRYYLVMALHAWCVYNKCLLDATKSHEDLLLIHYDDLMTSDVELDRLSATVGHPVQDCRRKNLRRSSTERTNTYGFVRWFVRTRYGLDADRIFRALLRARGVASRV